jgi:sulfur dioxygenase
VIFRQLFEPVSSTYTYLLGCERTGTAVLVDPVYDTIERDLALIRELQLTLAYTLDTHIHADHLTGARKAYVLEMHGTTRVFTGDCLLIDGCGRTDFQNGDARQQFRPVREKLFRLPDDALVYPCHDYQGRFVSTIAQEKTRNPRLGLDKSEAESIEIMNKLKLPYPKRIDVAVPGNRRCGEYPPDVPDELRRQRARRDQG